MANGICYACGAPETTREHVPPRCIFPEAKDAAGGVGFRENALTVPSCELHNTARSKDDEYFLCTLAMNILNNDVGGTQATTKVLRALKRSEGLEQRVLGQIQPVIVEDNTTGTRAKSVAVKVETARIENVLHHIAKALYFHHYGRPWDGTISCYIEFMMWMSGPNPQLANEHLSRFSATSDALFASAIKQGAHPDVFSYQIVQDPETPANYYLRLYFYEGSKATVFLRPAQPAVQADGHAAGQ